MKKILTTIVIISLFISCKKNDNESIQVDTASSTQTLRIKSNPNPVPSGNPISQADLDRITKGLLETRNDFQWEWVDLTTLWSALQYNNHTLAVGYKPTEVTDLDKSIDKIDISKKEWKAVHDALISLVLEELNKEVNKPVVLSDILIEDDKTLPILTFKLTNKNVLTRLFNLENVRYLEPLDYWPAVANQRTNSSSGCSASTEPLNPVDWTNIAPGARMPWNFNNLNIPTAWNTAEGRGIKIGVIDGGISATQALLGSQFTDGYSNVARTITTGYTIGTSAFTTCTHGTSMCGMAVGPRNTQNATTGVAYKASLHFIHGCNDVVLDESAEKTGVKNALVAMGDLPDVKVISMSVGTPFASSVLKDGANYAYNKGKMVLAAAGTSYSWTSWYGVIYPAAYSSCYAITGVNESGTTCVDCHDGSQVKFTIPMERNANTSRNSLSLPASGTTPSYIGGSSIATSTAAGIAALVWSVKPSLTRDQVFTILKNTSQYSVKTSYQGYGNLNAGAAVALALTY